MKNQREQDVRPKFLAPIGSRLRLSYMAMVTVAVTVASFAFAGTVLAAQPTVQLGKAAPFAVMAGTTVTNTGPTTISGSVGVSPGSAATGFPPALITNGTMHKADAVAAGAAAAVTSAYLDAAGRTPVTVVPTDLGGQTLTSGVYDNATALGITGTLTLNAQGNADAIFIFQSASSLITATSSRVILSGGAQACNVFWQVTSSATLGVGSTFVGTILALTSISVKTNARVTGRVLARNGQVSLESNVITRSICSSTGTTTTSSGGSTTTSSGGSTTTSSGGSTTTSSPGTSSTSPGSTNPIPSGAPATGGGGSAKSSADLFWLLGALVVVAAAATMSGAAVRSRSLHRSERSNDS